MSNNDSYQTQVPFVVNPQKAPVGPETYQEKALRKLKEQPLVPVGVLATCGALTIAFVRQRQGRSRDFNYWLRWRIGLQAATIVAVVGGTYALGNTKQQIEARQREMDVTTSKERDEFNARLAEAEQAHAAEEAAMKGASAGGAVRNAPAGMESVGRMDVGSSSTTSLATPAGVDRMKGGKSWWNPSTW